MLRLILALAASLTLFWLAASDSGAQPHAAGNKPHVPAGWPTEATGYGKTVDDAKAKALGAAAERVTACLRAQTPPLEAWQADEEYVRKNLLQGPGRQGEDVKVADNVAVKTWILTLKEAPNWAEMVQLNQAAQRHELAAERRSAAGGITLLLTALFTAAWGYFRIDAWTKGRFSTVLLIGAAALLALTGAAWWLA
jgi:hypothetical protein